MHFFIVLALGCLCLSSFAEDSKLKDPYAFLHSRTIKRVERKLESFEKQTNTKLKIRLEREIPTKKTPQFDGIELTLVLSKNSDVFIEDKNSRLTPLDLDFLKHRVQLYLKREKWGLGVFEAITITKMAIKRQLIQKEVQPPQSMRTLGLLSVLISLLVICLCFARTISIKRPGLFLFSLFLGWTFYHFDLYFEPKLYLPRDSYDNFGFFAYVANFGRYLGSLPTWFFSEKGGVWFEVLSNSYLFLYPIRWVGWLFSWWTPFSLNTIWKVSFLVVGQGVFLWAIYQIALDLFASKRKATLVTAIAILSPLNVAILHQEQAQATFIFIPFFWMCLLRLSKHPAYLLVLCSLFGFSLNIHYPQIPVVYCLLTVICALAFTQTRNWLIATVNAYRQPDKLKWVIASFLFLIVSSSPVLYSYFHFHGKLSSPHRKQGKSLQVGSYADYKKIDGIYTTAMFPAETRHYFQGPLRGQKYTRRLDNYYFYMSAAIALLVVLLTLLAVPQRGFQLSLISLLTLSAFGVHSFIPKLLWPILPGIEIFRQWFHFSGYLNLHLLFLLASSLFCFFETTPTKRQQTLLFFGGAVVLFFWLRGYLPIAFGLGGLIAIVLKVGTAHSKVLLPLYTSAWIFFSNVVYANSAMAEYRYWALFHRTPHLSPTSEQQFLEDILFSGYPIQQQAQPKELKLSAVKHRKKNFLWISKEGWKQASIVTSN